MISIRVQNLTKRFGAVTALAGVSLEIAPGELFFILGPSGCGKTTFLRALGGLAPPDEGRVFFGGEDVTRLEAHKRNTGMMFQSYALWPHKTAAQNVAFGLEERKVAKDEISRRVGEALESVRMGACAGRRPHELSGGEQQRVALARALVIRPRCLLLDEPLSNLDARLRLEMREEIRRVCKESRVTAVYVTHDQKEALSISDRMAVLEAGRVLQVGAPAQVYRRPASRAVAGFIGEADFISGKVLESEGDLVLVETPLGIFAGFAGDSAARPARGGAATVSIRPESWKLGAAAAARNRVRGRVGSSVYLGEMTQYEFLAGEARLRMLELNPSSGRARGDEQLAGVEPEDVVVLLE